MTGPVTCPCAEREHLGAEVSGADTCAIIAAGGLGSRFGDERGKQYVTLCGLPVAAWPVLAFDRAPSVAQIVVVCPAGRIDETRDAVMSKMTLTKPVSFVVGGATRQDSVFAGLEASRSDLALVAIHDAARPLITVEAIEGALAEVRDNAQLAGAICASRVTDTLKIVEGDVIVSTPDRAYYWAAQTPQVFRRAAVLSAHRIARREGFVGTDDASLVERQGGLVKCVETPRDNIKITVPEDLAVAEATLRARFAAEGCGL